MGADIRGVKWGFFQQRWASSVWRPCVLSPRPPFCFTPLGLYILTTVRESSATSSPTAAGLRPFWSHFKSLCSDRLKQGFIDKRPEVLGQACSGSRLKASAIIKETMITSSAKKTSSILSTSQTIGAADNTLLSNTADLWLVWVMRFLTQRKLAD